MIKPVNTVQSTGHTIRVNDTASEIKLTLKNSDGQAVNLKDKIDYFYITKDNIRFYYVTNIRFDGDTLIFKLPPVRKGNYKISIKDTDGHIYPAGEDINILLRQSFDGQQLAEYTTIKESIIDSVKPTVIDYINENPDKLKGDKGDPGRIGSPGIQGPPGRDGKDGTDIELELDDDGNLYAIYK